MSEVISALRHKMIRYRSDLARAVRTGLGVLFLPAVFSGASASELAFRSGIIDASPPSDSVCCLDVCAIGDIDGDGISDVLVASQSSVGAVWYHASDWIRYAVGAGSFSTDGEVADIDGDGDSDVVLSCVSRDRIEWWENLGDPTQANGWACYPIGDDFAHDVCIGDIDGDGNLDVVVFRKDLEVLWFQAPPDRHGSWTRRSISELYGEGLDLADIDGDGDLDVAASQWWCENENGQGTSWALWMVAPDWESSCRDVVADVNGDGMKDIVLSHSEGSGQVAWFENPSWTGHVIEPDTLVGAHSLEVVDFDHDGDPDVFTGEMHTGPKKRVLAYRNNGGGLSWSRTTLAMTGTHNARVGDVTGDGRIDIVGKNYDGVKEMDLWENRSLLVGIESPAPPSTTPTRFGCIPIRFQRTLISSSISSPPVACGFRYMTPPAGSFACSPTRPSLPVPTPCSGTAPTSWGSPCLAAFILCAHPRRPPCGPENWCSSGEARPSTARHRSRDAVRVRYR